MIPQILIAKRFNGPPDSGNGGFVSGKIAEQIGSPCEVTLRKPPPLDTAMDLTRIGEIYQMTHEGVLIATAELTDPPMCDLAPVNLATARAAAELGYALRCQSDVFTTCFVCGQDRAENDGLRLFAGMPPDQNIDGSLQPVAVAWTPFAGLASDGVNVDEAHIWAAMDCPSAAAINNMGAPREPLHCLLGRFRNAVIRAPRVGEDCVITAQMTGRDGRKIYCDVALFSAMGEMMAQGKTTWIELT